VEKEQLKKEEEEERQRVLKEKEEEERQKENEVEPDFFELVNPCRILNSQENYIE